MLLTQKPNARSRKPNPTTRTQTGGNSMAFFGNDSKPYPAPSRWVSNARFSFDMMIAEPKNGRLMADGSQGNVNIEWKRRTLASRPQMLKRTQECKDRVNERVYSRATANWREVATWRLTYLAFRGSASGKRSSGIRSVSSTVDTAQFKATRSHNIFLYRMRWVPTFLSYITRRSE